MLAHRWPIAAALILIAACGGKLFTITLSEEATTVIDKGTVLESALGELGFGDLLDVDIRDSEELENQGVEPGDIKEVYLVDFVLRATEPPDGDLSFLTRVDIIVGASGLPDQVIASATSFPAGLQEVVFDLEDVDLTDYVVSESMQLTTEATGKRPDETTTVRADFDIEVGVTGQGACSRI